MRIKFASSVLFIFSVIIFVPFSRHLFVVCFPHSVRSFFSTSFIFHEILFVLLHNESAGEFINLVQLHRNTRYYCRHYTEMLKISSFDTLSKIDFITAIQQNNHLWQWFKPKFFQHPLRQHCFFTCVCVFFLSFHMFVNTYLNICFQNI